jgi:hypothetical protein
MLGDPQIEALCDSADSYICPICKFGIDDDECNERAHMDIYNVILKEQKAEIERLNTELESVRQESAQRIAELTDENAALRKQMCERLFDETKIVEILFRNGVMNVELEGGACRIFAEMFAEQIAKSNAENYLEVSFYSKLILPDEKLVVTIQRCKGKTPHQLRKAAEDDLAALQSSQSQVSDEVILSFASYAYNCGRDSIGFKDAEALAKFKVLQQSLPSQDAKGGE